MAPQNLDSLTKASFKTEGTSPTETRKSLILLEHESMYIKRFLLLNKHFWTFLTITVSRTPLKQVSNHFKTEKHFAASDKVTIWLQSALLLLFPLHKATLSLS